MDTLRNLKFNVLIWGTLFCCSESLATDFLVTPSIRAETLNYLEPLSTNTNQNLWSFREELSGRWKMSSDLRLNFSGRAQQDPANASGGEKYFADLTELYLEYKTGYTRFQAGQMIFNWPGTDGYNPVDLVSAKRLYDPLRPDKLGVPAVALKSGGDNFEIQCIYIPSQTKTILPGEGSRWLPREFYIPPTSNYKFILPQPVSYTYGSDIVFDRALENNFGMRGQFHLGTSEFALMYYDGVAGIPSIAPTINGTITSIIDSKITIQAQPNIILQSEYYKIKASGFTSTIPIKENIFRGVFLYTQPQSVGLNIPGWSYNIVLSIERTFSLGGRPLTFIPQYSYSKTQTTSGNEPSSISRVFDSASLLGLRYSPSETWTLLLSYLYDFLEKEQFGSLSVTKNWSDNIKTELTAQVLSATPTAPLGSYRKNNRLIFNLTWLH